MWSICGILLALGCVQARSRLDPLVDTNQGLIRGLQADDGAYSKFLGIPYAQVNSSNPFGGSFPYPKSDTVYEAYDDSIACPQGTMALMAGISDGLVPSLDCLRLNIYVPNEASSRNKLPVVVNIHGGAFTYGTGRIGAKDLVQHGVVVVSINYRLGPYGFMCLDTPEVPGNQGLKDQYAALEWVQKNIGSFGGDERKVTVMGGSAGSMSIDFHLLSKRPKLFNRAIMMSGSAINPNEVIPADTTVPLRLAAVLGYETDDVQAALEFLSKTEVELVTAAFSTIEKELRPCVEKEFEGVEAFVPEHPEHSDVSTIKNIAILSGVGSHEETRRINKPAEYYQSSEYFQKFLNGHFDFGEDREMAEIVRHFYVGDEIISEDLKWKIVDFASDFQCFYPSQRSLVRYSEKSGLNVYYYIFAYDGGMHGGEGKYLFGFHNDTKSSLDETQMAISKVTTLWTNFVKFGDPTPEVTDLLPIKWLPMTKDSMHYMHLDHEMSLRSRPYHDRSAFWDLFYKLNENKLIANRLNGLSSH
ncbi:esterase FE4-like isoform X2 [Aricia agestis]|uniref:esterase FE4-like isoform X2 n=1 Tax=Aricia agestis TaxID=91739 RepID=UPI001C202AD4|nr:esterase FE4-like isoform X2 [Aricia agestis]XP_041983343.1 esterase FE4-like isoform X2 [Aricia agestis]